MQVGECLEQIGRIPEELRSRLGLIRELDSKVRSEREKIRDNIEKFFNVATTMSRDDQERRWRCCRQAAVNVENMAVKKVKECESLKEMLKSYAERLKLEVDRAARLLEEEDPGILERIRQNREAERRAQENARLMRNMRKLRSAQRLKAARRRRLNHMRHRRPSTALISPVGLQQQPSEPPAAPVSDVVIQSVPETTVEVKTEDEEEEEPILMPNETNADSNVFQLTKSDHESQAILKLLTEHAESRHGRVRKVSSRVSNGLLYEMRARELAMRRIGKSCKKASSSRKRSRPSLQVQKSTPTVVDEVDETVTEGKSYENEDDDSRTWCICHQPSYGFMVACDSADCPYVWFHGSCVGIESPITGKWFCSMCIKRLGIEIDELQF